MTQSDSDRLLSLQYLNRAAHAAAVHIAAVANIGSMPMGRRGLAATAIARTERGFADIDTETVDTAFLTSPVAPLSNCPFLCPQALSASPK